MGFLQTVSDFLLGPPKAKQMTWESRDYSNMYPVRTTVFDGEKTPYELGEVQNVIPNYHSLRLRSHEADLKSDVVKIITNKFFKWVIGTGLKLQSEPVLKVLESEKIIRANNDLEDFKANVEARFNLWAKSKRVCYKGEKNLHELGNDTLKSSFIGGDVLVIIRVENSELNVQLIDGQQVQTPILEDEHHKQAKSRGNSINNGIEKDDRGRHVAYFVKVYTEKSLLGEYVRIPAYGEKTKRKMAWLVYFDKHRIDHDRGIGALAPILEKIDKLDRYTEATVGSAEERAKIPYAIEHTRDSSGENPMAQRLAKSLGRNNGGELDPYSEGDKKADHITRTTGKMAVNLPIGSKLTSPSSSSGEINYPEFWKAVFQSLAAAVDIPPEVALQMYNSNYSASRAAISAWEHLMFFYRNKYTQDFYQIIYQEWLHLEIIKSKIDAPGYLQAVKSKKYLGVEAYASSRFLGSRMPHIDPKKEIDAARAMLGEAGKNIPLASFEQVAERMNLGDWSENYKKYLKETESIKPEDGTDQKQNSE
ncbi:phage portal protein [Christiangramia sp.]|uniref:phage portal protein n=1 Tax=Christiangramia sp. TaxID=1931228 RepID=UPI002608194A|nr:phage portal protein [Christiangramia sp.]